MNEPGNKNIELRETIRISDGRFLRLELHHDRLTRSSAALGRRALNLYEIETALSQAHYSYTKNLTRNQNAQHTQTGRLRCRLSYTEVISSIQIEPYTPRRPLVLVATEAGSLEYKYKCADRQLLDDRTKESVSAAKESLARYSRAEPLPAGILDADWDVLLHRGGSVMDASYANIVWRTPSGDLTPATPLLEGVRRRAYLNEGRIRPADLNVDDLYEDRVSAGEPGEYRLVPVNGTLYLINAMLDLEDEIAVDWLAIPG